MSRRLSTRVQRPRIPIARLLAEFGIIVIGVLVALAVDSWAEGRGDRVRERAYLEQLHEDLTVTLARADSAVVLERNLHAWTQALLIGLDADPLPPADSLAFWVEESLRSYSFIPVAGTIDALIETGDITLIRSTEVRRSLISARQLLQNLEYAFQIFDDADLAAVASLNRRVNRWAISRGTSPARYPVDWEEIAADHVVRGDLMTHRIAVFARARATEDLANGIRPLLALLDAELEE